MFEAFDKAPPDAILGLTEAFNQDTNPDKINLTVGVYRDALGTTPILNSVKQAERRLLELERTKGYLGIDGMPEFGARVRELLFGDDASLSERSATVQTPGGTAALRVAAELLKRKLGGAKVWHSRPTWANHPSILVAADRQVETYAYLDQTGTKLDFDGMLGDLNRIPRGDVVLLHACCHNPTGVDPTSAQWKQIAEVVAERQLLPLVDFAYQGFGDGLVEDAHGLRTLAAACPELLICSSFSKNFGLYGERVGCITIVGGSPEAAGLALGHAKTCVRANYSNPPLHGAAIVTTILGDASLRSEWEGELAAMRGRIQAMRELFVAEMRRQAPAADFSFIATQKGMFSYSGLTPVQVDELRSRYSIYVVATGGRINVAGVTEENVERLCSAIASVL